MRRMTSGRVLFFLFVWGILAPSAGAQQQGPINARIPPPPPREVPATSSAPAPASPISDPEKTPLQPNPLLGVLPPSNLPASVQVPAGTRLSVILDTPLSTRIAKKGQVIRFHTEDAFRVHELLEVPPETEITGTVVEAKKPGLFGKPGVLRVKLDSMRLASGAEKEIAARLDSPDMKGNGRLTSDSRGTTDLASLALYTVEGTLIGAQIHGGKGAAIGAGAGALAAILIAMSHKGTDLYLEPGMPFAVILDQPVELAGQQVYEAQQAYEAAHPAGTSSGERARGNERNTNGPSDPSRPKLKRRPRIP
jgi:hypothetical protein